MGRTDAAYEMDEIGTLETNTMPLARGYSNNTHNWEPPKILLKTRART